MQHNPSFIPVTPANKTIGLTAPSQVPTLFPTAVGSSNNTLRLVNVPTTASRPTVTPRNAPSPTASPTARSSPFEFPTLPARSPLVPQTRIPSRFDVFNYDSDPSTDDDFDTDTDTDSDDEYYLGFGSPSNTTFSPIGTTPTENKLPLLTHPRLGSSNPTSAPLPPAHFQQWLEHQQHP